MHRMLVELLNISIIIQRSKLGALRASAIEVDITLVGTAAPSHVLDRISTVWPVAFSRCTHWAEPARSTAHVLTPLDELIQLTKCMLVS